MYQRIAREQQPANAAIRQAPHPDHHIANAIGKTTLLPHVAPHFAPADRYTIGIEAAQRQVRAVRTVLLPALIKALRANAKQAELMHAAMQLRYMLTSVNEQVCALEKAATYRDPMLQFLRREIDTLVARCRRLGVYQGREHLIPRGHEEESIKHKLTKAHRTLRPADHKHEPAVERVGQPMHVTRPPNRPTSSTPSRYRGPVQRKAAEMAPSTSNVHEVAAAGVAHASSPLPFASIIQKAFGRHDVSGVRARIGGPATEAAQAIGARAYTTGNTIAFAAEPDLHTAAHEAAHVIQQRSGVAVEGGIDRPGDAYEQHADLVADVVVRGESAEALLDRVAGRHSTATAAPVVQRKVGGSSKQDSELGLYLKIHKVDLHSAIREQLAETAWPDPAPDVPFARGGDRVFAATLADALADRLDDGEGFRKFIYPGNILARFREQVVNRQTWSPQFGESLAQLVERHAIASLSERIGPRYRAVLASKVQSPTADDLMGSHPMDPFVARALTQRGVVDQSHVATTEKAQG